LQVMLPFFGIEAQFIDITIKQIAITVGIYLGIPFVAAVLSRWLLIRTKGEKWFTQTFIPFISPLTLIALLFTIVLMFSLKGDMIIQLPLDVLMIALPLVIFFSVMFFLMFFVAKAVKVPFKDNMSLSFTASGNNFELAIAVSIGVFGINSGQAFAGVIGPLVEVPALITLVSISRYLNKKYYS